MKEMGAMTSKNFQEHWDFPELDLVESTAMDWMSRIIGLKDHLI